MVALRVLALSSLRAQMMPATPFSSSMAMTGKVVLLKSARTAMLAADLAWASVAEVAMAVVCAEDLEEDLEAAAVLAEGVEVSEAALVVEASVEVLLAAQVSNPLPAPSLLTLSLTSLPPARRGEKSSTFAT